MTRIRHMLGLGGILLIGVATAGAGNARFEAAFQSDERAEACPPEYSPQTTVCRSFTASALVKGLGMVTIRQRNVIQSVGFVLQASGTFSVRGLGEVAYAGDNSAYAGKNKFDFTFSAGTGKLAGASGSGTVTNSLNERPTAFWEGSLVAPEVTFDLAAPALAITRTTVERAGSKLRVRVAYTLRDGSVPVTLRAVVGRTVVKTRATRAAGTVALLVPGRPQGARIIGLLAATDAVGNTTTRSFAARV